MVPSKSHSPLCKDMLESNVAPIVQMVAPHHGYIDPHVCNTVLTSPHIQISIDLLQQACE